MADECTKQPLLAAYHDDELSPADRAAVEEHLRTCESCRAELETLRAMSNPLRQFRDERMSDFGKHALHQKLDEESVDDSRFVRFAQTLGVIAASILLIGVAWLKALPASSSNSAVKPVGPVVVSPMTLQPWERSAITLRPDPSSMPLPGGSDDPKSDLAAAHLDSLKLRSER
jgi:anti-sigma factor RsiW